MNAIKITNSTLQEGFLYFVGNYEVQICFHNLPFRLGASPGGRLYDIFTIGVEKNSNY